MLLLGAFTLSLFMPGLVPTAPDLSRASIVVVFEAERDEHDWIANALQKRVERELSRFHRVILLEPSLATTKECDSERCLVAAYAAAGADFVMLGALDDVRLRYQTFAGWTRTRVDGGNLFVGPGASLGRVENEVATAVRPLVASGGFIDRRPTAVAVEKPQLVVGPSPLPSRPRLPASAIVGAVLLLIASPLFGLRRLMTSQEIKAALRPRSLRYSALGIVGLSATLVITALPQADDLLTRLALLELPLPTLWPLVPVVGGILWAGLVILVSRLAVPPLYGLERTGHQALGPLLRAWMLVVVMRVVALGATLVPALVLVDQGAAYADVEPFLRRVIVVPAAGLLLYYWLASLIDHLAIYLDHYYVQGPVSSRHPWHGAVKRYLASYAQRTGLVLEPRLMARVLFLPGKGEASVTYGGGFAATRMVISQSLLETALGPLPSEPDAPERRVDWNELPRGLVLPTVEGESQRKVASRSRLFVSSPSTVRAPSPRLLGEHATVLGYIMPQPQDEAVPLISNNSEDFAVVRQLLTEHYAAFEKKEGDDEYEGAVVTHKDFLFGCIVRELGMVERRDGFWQTLVLAASLWSEKATRFTRFVVRAISAAYDRMFSRYPAILADAYAALGFARDHLIQYLNFQRTWAEDRLTARADAPRLVARSSEILRAIEKEKPEGKDTDLFRATLRNRLVWLSRFFYTPLEEPKARVVSMLATLAVVGVCLAIVGDMVKDAVAYHPIYVDRMAKEQARITQALQEETQDGGQH